ncbi:MAG TPA: hypothetical protein VFT24_12580 [Vicinamibacterales bacterium]|nr:hypothetical protein [Vicinamibacterales bacterium]
MRPPPTASFGATWARTRCRDVFGAFTQRRHAQWKHVEAVEEIRPEHAFLDSLFQAAMGGRDDSGVDRDRLHAAQPFDLPLLQDPWQLDLHFRWQIPNLVEKDVDWSASSNRPTCRVNASVYAPFSRPNSRHAFSGTREWMEGTDCRPPA